MNSSHETLYNAELFMQHLGEGCQAVGCAGCIRENGSSIILGVVHTHNVHRGILGRSRNDDSLAASLKVLRCLFDRGEHASGFTDCVSTSVSPLDFSRIALGKKLDFDVSDEKASINNTDISWVHAMNRVMLELVRSIFETQERVVDSNDGSIRVFNCSAHYKTTDASESVDSQSNWHCYSIRYDALEE